MNIDTLLVKKLIAEQFPKWKDLPIKPVAIHGWDNRTFHLGQKMLVRLPSNEDYAPQILKEFQWLPKLSKHLSYQITTPVALGHPSVEYPWHWSINGWIEGETASIERVSNMNQFAHDLGQFLTELQSINSTNGPEAGTHNFYRGGGLSAYDHEMQMAIPNIKDSRERTIAARLWHDVLASDWINKPVWVHGDIATGNLLVREGKLCAVIDFGLLSIGDPACDLAIAWNFFTGESRETFKKSIALDQNTWIRALGWTFWKALCWPVKGMDVQRIIHDVYDTYQKMDAQIQS